MFNSTMDQVLINRDLVSVIIVNYNTKDLTINCIQSVYDHTKSVDFEIIVVDNASTDGSVAAIKDKYPDVILIQSSRNLGFGRANNLAFKTAKGSFLFFLNSDTVLLNDAIKYLYEAYHSYGDKIGCMGTILCDADKKPVHSFGTFPTFGSILSGYIKGRYLKIREQEPNIIGRRFPLTVDYITGADLYISASLFKRIGQFDESFFMYFEETDLQKRISEQGLNNIIINDAQIIHLAGGSFKKRTQPSNNGTMMIERSMFHYLKKNNKSLSKYILFRFCYLLIRFPHLFSPHYTPKDQWNYLKFLIRIDK